jgi:cyclopropane-fatty-acyl-phospholipid synthase
MLLHALLNRTILEGRLSVVFGDGAVRNYGDGSGPPVAVRLTRAGALRIALEPALGLGEAYMDGDLVLDRGDLWDLLNLIGRNFRHDPRKPGPWRKLIMAIDRRLHQMNDRIAARRNVSRHYDLSFDLYRRFLDGDLQYSCAYFAKPDMSLDEAQAAKKAHIAAKLNLEPGLSVLDIGCGWGGMGLTLAGDYGARVTGVTLSQEQLAVATRRAQERGLEGRASFELKDYRDIDTVFDRIVSVGMFEHVGAPNYLTFFTRVRELLSDNGVAVIHSIGRYSPPSPTDPFIAKYVFPGGYIPALSEVLTAVEQAGLWVTDIEILRLHYAETLRCWRERFLAQRGAVALMYDERFCRMWEYYLAVSELSFRHGDHMVFQLQLAKRVDAAPIVRDYMVDLERQEPSRWRRTRTRAG